MSLGEGVINMSLLRQEILQTSGAVPREKVPSESPSLGILSSSKVSGEAPLEQRMFWLRELVVRPGAPRKGTPSSHLEL